MAFKKLMDSQRVSLEHVGELTDKTVSIKRVAKVVKGGRRFSFSAVVVSGNNAGFVGIGLGKASEVPDAIRKATEQARKSLVKIPLKGTTIPHDVIGDFGPTKVVLKPAGPGTGVIAGSAVRALVELAGIRDIRTKIIGSSNAQNVLHSTMSGLLSLKDPEVVATQRATGIDEMGYRPF